MTKFIRSPALLIDLAVVLAATVAGFIVLGGIDFFEWWHEFTRAHENLELDELASGLVGLTLGLVWFSVRRWRAAVSGRNQTNAATVEMRESEERFRGLFEHAAIGIAVSGLDGGFLRVNRRLCDILGYTEGELLIKKFQDLTHPDDVEAGVSNMRELLAGNCERFSIEKRYIRKNGATVWGDLTVSASRNEDGEPVNLVAFVQDVTDRKAAELAARDAESRFRAIAEATPIALVITRPEDGAVLYANVACEQLFGLSVDQLMGKNSLDFWADPVARDAVVQQLMRDGVVRNFETRVHDAAGNTKWVMGHAKTLSLKNQPAILAGFFDVTERKHLEEIARETDERLRAVTEYSPTAMLLKDLDGKYQLVNKTFEEWFGLPADKIVGKTVYDLYPKEYAEGYEALDKAALARNRPQEQEIEILLADGAKHWIQATKFPVRDSEGHITGIGGVGLDVTERKKAEQAIAESEERFRAVIDNSPNAILLKDLEGRYLLVNKVFEERYGRSRAELLGKSSYDVCDKARADALSAQDADVLATLRPVQCEHEIVFSDGVPHTLLMTKFPVFDIDGAPSGIGSISVDMTEHYRIEGQLRQAQKMEAVGQLTGGVAHDFNNLLAVITGNLELIMEALPDNQDLNEMTQRALRAADRGSSLTQRLLAFSRKQVLQPKPTDFNDLVADILDLLRRTLGDDIEIELHAAEGLWTCEADAGQLENAILNLAVNARDAMPAGGTLTLETENVVLDQDYAEKAEIPPGAYAMLAVSDTGEGMAPDVIEHAFEPFFTTKNVGEGTGLGLSMVYGFAKQSNGHATVYSEEGKGTTVKLYLPRVEAQIAAAPDRGTEQQTPAANGETVLVVEDDPNVRALVVTMLESLDYTVVAAEDGHAARAILDNLAAIDVLLTDVILAGGISGPEIANDIRHQRPEIAILFMSGYAANAKVTQAHLTAGDRLLQKPFRKPDLARMMREVLAETGAAT